MTIENEELSDDQLFNNAVGDEPEVIPEAPAEIEQPEKPATEVVAGSEAPAEKPVVDDNAAMVPSWRVREIREERDAIAARLASAEAAARVQPRQAEQPKPADKPARPDPLLDPDGYAAAVKQELREEAETERKNDSMARALETSPEEFKAAYKAATENGVIPELKVRMQNSRDPGKELLVWHKEQKTRAEVGNDLTAYKAKLREEALKDPEFRKAAMEAWRADAQTQPSNGRPTIDIPRSLSSLSRSSAAPKGGSEDVSDHELFEQTTG